MWLVVILFYHFSLLLFFWYFVLALGEKKETSTPCKRKLILLCMIQSCVTDCFCGGFSQVLCCPLTVYACVLLTSVCGPGPLEALVHCLTSVGRLYPGLCVLLACVCCLPAPLTHLRPWYTAWPVLVECIQALIHCMPVCVFLSLCCLCPWPT